MDETKLAHNALVSEIELHDMGKTVMDNHYIENVCDTETNQSYSHGCMNIEKVVQS